MAAYVKHGDQIVLALSLGEAQALRDAALTGESEYRDNQKLNPQTAAALDRATRAISTACERSSRSGAAIQ